MAQPNTPQKGAANMAAPSPSVARNQTGGTTTASGHTRQARAPRAARRDSPGTSNDSSAASNNIIGNANSAASIK